MQELQQEQNLMQQLKQQVAVLESQGQGATAQLRNHMESDKASRQQATQLKVSIAMCCDVCMLTHASCWETATGMLGRAVAHSLPFKAKCVVRCFSEAWDASGLSNASQLDHAMAWLNCLTALTFLFLLFCCEVQPYAATAH